MSEKYKDFLFELGTEELPAGQLPILQQALLKNTLEQLEQAQLTFLGAPQVFATPRRLALLIPQLQTQQKDQIIERKGPSVQNAFDQNGAPTKACLGFAEANQVPVEKLVRRETAHGVWLFAEQHIPGQAAGALLPEMIKQAIAKLPIAKSMRWGDHPYHFLRPVQWVVMMLGHEVIDAQLFDLSSSNHTYGHRFMAPGPIVIDHPEDYVKKLAAAKVIADFDTRQALIVTKLQDAAQKLNGVACIDDDLLTEVTGLVEWPEVLTAHFAASLLEVPEQVLIASMTAHQKSFAVKTTQGALLPHFLIVSNLISKEPAQVMIGNERVMNARLRDAEFFYRKDLLTPLQDYCADLKKVVFQAKLGSVYDKSQALAQLVHTLATQLDFDAKVAHQTGLIAKCDLRTEMVNEFPELQGVMGGLYADKQGLGQAISSALWEQYLPRFAADQLPKTPTGMVLALADRLLNMVGIFGIGQVPTGEKDPFALRRAAIGICRIIVENNLSIALLPLLMTTQSIWEKQGITFDAVNVIDLVYDFIIERFRYLYLEKGYRPQVIQAVLSKRLDDLADMDQRIRAIDTFLNLPEAPSLAAAQKRVLNLLQKEALLLTECDLPDPALFELSEEKALSDALIEMQAAVTQDYADKNYLAVLNKMTHLKKPVDDFFERVMVMIDDRALRHNRLCLLHRLSWQLNQVADISVAAVIPR